MTKRTFGSRKKHKHMCAKAVRRSLCGVALTAKAFHCMYFQNDVQNLDKKPTFILSLFL